MIKTEKLKVSDNPSLPNDVNSIAEFESDDKGVAFPNVPKTNRDSMTGTIKKGTLTFDPDTNRFVYWNGTTWVQFGRVKSEYRHEFIEPYDYIAKAPKGTLETDNLWFITRITIASNGSTLSEIAVNVDWTNRYTHIYT